jgi:uracil-DNA glycosylase family 4
MASNRRLAPIPYAEGPKNARIMLVGQNPGKEEVKQRRPFVGRTGKYFKRVLQKKGLDWKKLYVTAVVKEPTPGNRKPNAREIERWMPVLIKEIKKVKPRIVVLMGRVAWETPRFKGIEYMETYHPTAAMRFPQIRKKFEKDMDALKRKATGR